MAFLDDLDKKITQIGKTAVQKTKDMTDSVRITGEISSEEAKIDQCYAQIGRLYIQQTAPDNLLDQCQVLHNQIIEMENRIKALNLQKTAGNTTMNCPGCKAVIPADSAFCNVCGARVVNVSPMPSVDICDQDTGEFSHCNENKDAAEPLTARQDECETTETDSINCPSCGSSLGQGQEFCIYCGTKVVGAEITEDVEATEFATSETENGDDVVEETFGACPACGAEVSEGQMFCIECGAKLS